MTSVDQEGIFSFWRRPGDEDGRTMRSRLIRRRCTAMVRALNLPPDADVDRICTHVAEHLGSPIRALPMSLGGVVSGMTISSDGGYWICYETDTSPRHQLHVLMHELGHLLLGHEKDHAVTEEALTLWAPSIDAATAMRHMEIGPGHARHHRYDKPAEREAETMAQLLMERVAPVVPQTEAPLEGKAAQIAAQIGPALQHLPAQRARESADSGGEERA